jgi:hypothetical protein
MKKFPKPWYRPSRGVWYVTLNDKQHNLGPDREAAFKKYGELLANPPKEEPKETPPVLPTLLVGLIQEFMADLRANAATDTIEWYRYRLQLLVDHLSTLDRQGMAVTELERADVTKWMNAYPHLSGGSKRNLGRSIQRVMSWAAEQ